MAHLALAGFGQHAGEVGGIQYRFAHPPAPALRPVHQFLEGQSARLPEGWAKGGGCNQRLASQGQQGGVAPVGAFLLPVGDQDDPSVPLGRARRPAVRLAFEVRQNGVQRLQRCSGHPERVSDMHGAQCRGSVHPGGEARTVWPVVEAPPVLERYPARMTQTLKTMVAQARGGRVVRSAFLAGDDLDRRLLAGDDIRHVIAGGFPDARRVVLTLHPAHIPEVDSGVTVLRVTPGAGGPPWDVQDFAVQLRRLNLPEDQLGDVREERSGAFLIAATGKAVGTLEALTELGGREVEVEEVGESAGRGSKTREVVVPSMRVDVVGAKGFGVSRAYFQQGIDGGKVRLNGQAARASSEIREGDSLSADGLGRIDFKRVVNETRRGNFKVELDVHR
ncbi:RNA-binding protein YlmH, contains S4-like domain [Deinococcus hopiensis KR-140]|uniref:RNA-binding protein YlmH, contains S4-like domain n=2 Tax=Deinococcus TaxID=1298 RepID=A0A1W1VQR7_9DEIO|nr:RNA-binding protein YlmH, contains S4-like domain [Deinococcus hopiensis KR-140]